MQVSEARVASLVAGNNLRASRERLGITRRDVKSASMRLAAGQGKDEFALNPGGLSDIETKGLVPSVYRLYTLAIVYRCDLREILSWYGVDLNLAASDLKLTLPPKSHCSKAVHGASVVQMPTRLDPSFDSRRTSHLSRMVKKWRVVPFTYLDQFSNDKYAYVYIGSEDFTMYPLLPPGTFLQVDESKNKVLQGMWRSEIERPIYFVETREGYTCSWCMLKGDYLVLQPRSEGTRLNSSHSQISYAVFCLKKKNISRTSSS